jgi:phage shock protein A
VGVFSRIGLLFRMRANRAMDAIERPEDALELAYGRQLEALQKVRSGIADVVTSQKQLEIQQRQMQSGRKRLDELARTALLQNREDLAAGALTQGELIDAQLQGLQTQITSLAAQRDNLQAAGVKLQARVAGMRTQKETLKAQYNAARATVAAGETVTGVGRDMDDVELLLDRARAKMLATQARAEAVTELMETGVMGRLGASASDEIEATVAARTASDSVEVRLLELKQQLGLDAPKVPPHVEDDGPH